jgi:hypothetical protein
MPKGGMNCHCNPLPGLRRIGTPISPRQPHMKIALPAQATLEERLKKYKSAPARTKGTHIARDLAAQWEADPEHRADQRAQSVGSMVPLSFLSRN